MANNAVIVCTGLKNEINFAGKAHKVITLLENRLSVKKYIALFFQY